MSAEGIAYLLNINKRITSQVSAADNHLANVKFKKG